MIIGVSAVPQLPKETEEVLNRFHFDRVPFQHLQDRYLDAGTDPEALHRITEPVEVPRADAAAKLPPVDSHEYAQLEEEGQAAIAGGQLAVVVLAGGMATRFGSSVKGLAKVLDRAPKLCFLDYKLADAGRFANLSVVCLTSFATNDAIASYLQNRGAEQVQLASQFVSMRLAPDGTLFVGADARPSLHAPGHGDLPDALAVAGLLDQWRASGVTSVLMTNVDNLGATIDPALFAWHLRNRAAGSVITVELVEKIGRDRGGMPVRRADGSLVLAESFRLPDHFAQDEYPLFNTNTLWIDLPALDPPHPWTWSVARKSVEGRPAIQFERLVGELTWWHPSSYVHVSRTGTSSRFIPVKDVEDLAHAQDQIAAVVASRLGLVL
jgi:UTP--glucose-1-phosphate uridylyltransferase